jgi:ribosomal protein L33
LLGIYASGTVFPMSQVNLIKVKSPSGHVLFTRKNKKKVDRKLELKKFDKTTRKREIFKEVKK